MFLIDSPGATAANTFTAGNPFADPAIPPTIVSSEWLNMLQFELGNILVFAGLTPTKGVNNQVLVAIQKIIETYLDESMGRVVQFTADRDYAAGEGAQKGATFGITTTALLTSQVGKIQVFGPAVLSKVVGETLVAGDRMYWDDANKRVTLNPSGGKHLAGACTLGMGSAGTLTIVHLNGHHGEVPSP